MTERGNNALHADRIENHSRQLGTYDGRVGDRHAERVRLDCWFPVGESRLGFSWFSVWLQYVRDVVLRFVWNFGWNKAGDRSDATVDGAYYDRLVALAYDSACPENKSGQWSRMTIPPLSTAAEVIHDA